MTQAYIWVGIYCAQSSNNTKGICHLQDTELLVAEVLQKQMAANGKRRG